MSEPGKQDNQNENASAPEEQGQESLEDLISTLSKQINSSDFLKKNTAESFATENPDIAKLFNDLAEEKKKTDDSDSAGKS